MRENNYPTFLIFFYNLDFAPRFQKHNKVFHIKGRKTDLTTLANNLTFSLLNHLLLLPKTKQKQIASSILEIFDEIAIDMGTCLTR